MTMKMVMCIALLSAAFSGPVYGQAFDQEAVFGSMDGGVSVPDMGDTGQEYLTSEQQELSDYFDKMMSMRQRLYNQAVSGAGDQQTAALLDAYLSDLKRMPVPSSVRQYHDALVKIMETGSKYRASGAGNEQAGRQAMMREFNTILDEAGMLGAVQQQMQSMGMPPGGVESLEDGVADSQ